MWRNDILYPTFCDSRLINKEVFKSFIEHFRLTKTYNRVLTGTSFYNPERFMAGSSYYNSGKNFQPLFPHGSNTYFDHLCAYKDDDNHVLVVSHPYGINEEKILNVMQETGWVAIICDQSRAFYSPTQDVFYVATKETFEYFNSNGYFDDWGTKVLQ